jgi:hypothetical protein
LAKKSSSSLSDQQAQISANKAEMEKLWALDTKMNDAQFKRLELLEKETKALEKNSKALEKNSNSIKDQNKFLEDTEDMMASIGDKLGKSHKLYQRSEKYIESQKAGLKSISSYVDNIGDAKLADAAQEAADAYKLYQQRVAAVGDRTMLTGKKQEEANVAIQRARAELDASTASLASMGQSGEEVRSMINGMADETQDFMSAVTMTQKKFESLDAVMGQFSGIPVMSEINTLLKTNIRDTLAWKAAVFAVGAALGKAAYDYFGAPIKAAMQADKERAQNQIDATRDVAKLQKDSEFIPSKIAEERIKNEIDGAETVRKATIDAQFAAQKAAIQFSASMQTGAAQFQRAAKTALFGKGIGSVGYGAAQMQLAGIGAEKVASSMTAAASETGKMPSARIGADMAIMAERTGASVENVASINEMFQRIDGATEATAMNLSEGLRNMADQVGIGLTGLMQEMAESSKEMLGYQIKSGPALAKQVAAAQSLGVKFSDIAKAGKNMVLNYKDSIKAEMSLSSMLGKNVNLAEVRAKFMSGDTDAAMEALKAQGLDPASMDMFQQEQLSQALGGMDLSSLSKIANKDAANVGGLKAGNAKKGNQNFLTTTQSAEATLNSQQAAISAQTAIIDAQLSKAIGDAYLADPKYADYLKAQSDAEKQSTLLAAAMEDAWKQTDAYKNSLADTAQLDYVSQLKETGMSALSGVLGGLGTTLIDKGLGAAFKGVKSLFGKKGGGETPSAPTTPSSSPSTPSAPESPSSPSIPTSATELAAAGADALVPGAGGLVESISSQVEAVEEPLEKAMSFGEKLKDFGKGIGSFLKSVGKGIGDAIGGILQGVGKGLAALGTPQVLLGVVTMMGLGASLWIAGKGLQQFQGLEWETIGMAFVTLLGLGAVGAVLGTVAPFIIAGAVAITAMSVAFAAFGLASGIAIPNLMQFQSLNAGALTSVGGGLVTLAKGLGAFGAGAVMAAIGKFFGGGTFDSLKDISNYASPLQMTADAVWALSNAFGSLSSIDTSKLDDIPWGDMGEFASQGGKFVLANSGGGSFALSKQTTTNIDKMAKKAEESFKELKYNSDIQNKMVGILVGNLAALQQIAVNTAGDKEISLDGTKVNRKLLANIQTSFGLGRTP